MANIILGIWSWGSGMFGGDSVFGSHTAIAWAMTKGVQPIIGATKPHHVTEAAQVGDTCLMPSEVAALERLAAATSINTRGGKEGKA